MAQTPLPIKPRVKDAKAYEEALRRAYINPMFSTMRARLATVEAVNQAYDVIEEVVEEIIAQPQAGVPINEIQENLNRMQGYHKRRLIKTFRAALGVNINIVLQDGNIREFIRMKIAENVDLIKTIPPRMHESLKARIEKSLLDAPFDQQRLKLLLNDEYKSTGWNLRRLTRDQTSKTVGNLTQIRQQQLSIESYQWLTSQDERVRPSHAALSGRVFLWTQPPEFGHPGADIMCRCTARAVITKQNRERLKNVGAYSIV